MKRNKFLIGALSVLLAATIIFVICISKMTDERSGGDIASRASQEDPKDSSRRLEQMEGSEWKMGQSNEREGGSNGNEISRAVLEKRMGRKFTDEEVALKPNGVPWHAWVYSVLGHQTSVEMNGDVVFYGRVVDENGSPIEDVSIMGEVSWFEPSFAKVLSSGKKSDSKEILLTTDSNGRFEVIGVVGRDLFVKNFTKEGYKITGERKFKGLGEKKSWGFSFNPKNEDRHRPDPNTPVIFTMKKVSD